LLTPEQVEKRYENRIKHEQKITGLKEKIEDRRRKVYYLDLQGYCNQEIANQISVSLSTVEKDLHYMKYYCIKWVKDMAESSAGISTIESCSQIDIVLKELWSLFRIEKNVSTKKKILDSIAENSVKKINAIKGFKIPFSFLKRAKKFEDELEMHLKEELK